ncbi:MAG: hypothetical protein IT580_14825 [Verrucomicrobiales bacterium]|nr:hypothetical protein [Verrucomicrobiales bacterium]
MRSSLRSLLHGPVLACLALFLWSRAASAQTELPNGTTATGRIAVAGEVDTWTFAAVRGDTVALRIGEVFESEVDPRFSPWIRLEGPDGTQLGSGFGVLTGSIDVTAVTTGTYTVRVADGSSTKKAMGAYRLHLIRSPGVLGVAEGDEGGVLVSGANHTGRIHLGDLDGWTFEAAKGDRYLLAIGEMFEGETDPGFSPWIRLRGPDGEQLGSAFGTLTGVMEGTAPLTGTYTVIVSDGSNGRDATGLYRLTWVKVPGSFEVPAGDDGGPMSNGLNHAGRIHLGDLDPWTFSGAKGDAVSLRIGEVFEGEVDPGFAPWIRLVGPDGAQVGSGFGALVGGIDTTLPLTGTYTVVVADGSNGRDATGLYRLTVVRSPAVFEVAAGDEGGSLTNGWRHTGRIHLGDQDAWSFNATQGDSILVTVGEVSLSEVDPGFSPWIRLRGPDGQQLGSGFGVRAGVVEVEAPLSGTYTVIVADGSNGRDAQGAYQLTLGLVPERYRTTPGDEGGVVPIEGSSTGNLELGDVDLWTIGADAGQRIQIQVRETVSGSALTPWFKLYGTDGTMLRSVFHASAAEFEFVAAEHGLHTLIVRDGSNGRDATGGYELTVTGLRAQGDRLRIRRMDPAATQVRVTWPTDLSVEGFRLVSNPVLSAEGWAPVVIATEDNGLNVHGVLPVRPETTFLQLEKP